MVAVKKVLTTSCLCLAFSLVGPWLVLVNKSLLSDKGFPYPILLSSFGVLSSSIFTHVIVDVFGVAQVSKASREIVIGPDARYWRTVFPVGALYAASLAMGNICYLYLGVGLIQMLKSSTPALIMAFSYFGGVDTPTSAVVAAVALITLGTLVTCAGSAAMQKPSDSPSPSSVNPTFSWFGISLFFMSSSFESIRLVATQHLLTNAKFSVVEGQYFLSPPGAVCLLLLASFFEVPNALRAGALDVVAAEPLLFFLSAVLGVVVNYLGYFVIQAVGSLTLKTLGTLRNIGLVVYSVIALGEVVVQEEVVGYGVTLVGFAAYTYLSAFKTSQPPPSTMPSKEQDSEGGELSSVSPSAQPSLSTGSSRAPRASRDANGECCGGTGNTENNDNNNNNADYGDTRSLLGSHDGDDVRPSTGSRLIETAGKVLSFFNMAV